MSLDDAVVCRRFGIDAETVEDDEREFFHNNKMTKVNSYLIS